MAEYDFRSLALTDASAPLRAAQLPSAQRLRAGNGALLQHVQELHLTTLTAEEREKTGEPSTPEELRQNQIYARLSLRYPLLMERLKVSPTMMADALRTELALGQARGMFNQLRTGARVGGVVLAADLTEQIDKVESAVLRRSAEESADVKPLEKAQLKGRFTPLLESRELLWARSEGRAQRKEARQRQEADDLARLKEAQADVQRAEALRAGSEPAAAPQLKPARKKKA